MASETPGIQNKGLLIIAIVLAAIVVVVYNIHIQQVRKAGQGAKVRLLLASADLETGKIRNPDRDIEWKEVDEALAKGLGNVMKYDDLGFARTSELVQPVQKGQWLRWEHFMTSSAGWLKSQAIGRGMVARTLRVDPVDNLGDLIGVNSRVNILGFVNAKDPNTGKTALRALRVVEGLKVLAVGGKAGAGAGALPRGMLDEAQRSYRSITVEMTPKLSIEWDNVKSHIIGEIRLEGVRGAEVEKAPEISKDVPKEYTESAEVPRGGPTIIEGATTPGS
jgi:Flp pilus assembly protein CpaB